ncbi:hypothetical protein D3C87_2030110 [compost metagenome]
MRLLYIRLRHLLVLFLRLPRHLLDHDAVAQLKALRVDRHVAIEQDGVKGLAVHLRRHARYVVGGPEVRAVRNQTPAK